jgi:hypothetical protein
LARCIDVEDLNSCDENYTGNYSEFGTEECDYCTPDWVCSAYDGSCPTSHIRDCLSVSDTLDCYAETTLSSDQFGGNLTPYASTCGYNATYNTTADLTGVTGDILGTAGVETKAVVPLVILTFVLNAIGGLILLII